MNGITEFIKTLGPARLGAMGAVAAALIGFFVFLMLRLSAPQMTVLFSDLPFEDTSAIVKELESQNIEFQIKNDGAMILVPKDKVLRLRMKMSEDGLPRGGVVGYEIFDKGDTLGATSFVQNLNHLRALEGELARTIRALDRVQTARVHLVLPKRQLFSKEQAKPTASIVVRLRGGLDGGQIKAIQHLVASAVKSLKPSGVSIVDESGKLLASGEGDGEAFHANALEERNLAFERRMRNQLQEIITSVVGPGRARVQVKAEFDNKRVTQTSNTYDPDGRVVRSTQSREESSASTGAGANGTISVGNELPGADGANEGETKAGPKESAAKTEEVVNYEISKTTKTEVIEAGRLKRLSVAVLIDGLYAKSANGDISYQPRPQDQMDRIATLVRTAIGYDRERGDNVEIVNLRFAHVAGAEGLPPAKKGFFDLSKQDYFYIAELAVLLIVTLLMLLFVVRPLIRRIVTPDGDKVAVQAAAGDAPAQLPGPEGAVGGERPALPALPENAHKTAEMIDMAQVQGQIHAESVQKVGDLVEHNPQEAVSIIRNWMSEGAS